METDQAVLAPLTNSLMDNRIVHYMSESCCSAKDVSLSCGIGGEPLGDPFGGWIDIGRVRDDRFTGRGEDDPGNAGPPGSGDDVARPENIGCYGLMNRSLGEAGIALRGHVKHDIWPNAGHDRYQRWLISHVSGNVLRAAFPRPTAGHPAAYAHHAPRPQAEQAAYQRGSNATSAAGHQDRLVFNPAAYRSHRYGQTPVPDSQVTQVLCFRFWGFRQKQAGKGPQQRDLVLIERRTSLWNCSTHRCDQGTNFLHRGLLNGRYHMLHR